LNDKSKSEIPFNNAPNNGNNEKITGDLKKTSELKSCFNPNPTRFTKNIDSGREFVLKKLILN
jgi:hypothetical protein